MREIWWQKWHVALVNAQEAYEAVQVSYADLQQRGQCDRVKVPQSYMHTRAALDARMRWLPTPVVPEQGVTSHCPATGNAHV